MRHRLAPPPPEYKNGLPEFVPEYELTDSQAETLLDEGVIYHCEMHENREESVYHVDPEFAGFFDDPQEMWRDIQARLARLAHPAFVRRRFTDGRRVSGTAMR